MQLTIFSVHDSKAEAFICPFFSQNSAVGLRMFTQACNDTASQFAINAGDYTLFEMGTFDQDKGQFQILDAPINHGLALTYIIGDPQRRIANQEDVLTMTKAEIKTMSQEHNDALRAHTGLPMSDTLRKAQ